MLEKKHKKKRIELFWLDLYNRDSEVKRQVFNENDLRMMKIFEDYRLILILHEEEI